MTARILVVDDIEANVRLLEAKLTAEYYEVLTASDGPTALAIAASEASGLKENFGTMVKPLHAGIAARNGVLAAKLAQAGMTGSAVARIVWSRTAGSIARTIAANGSAMDARSRSRSGGGWSVDWRMTSLL